LLRPRQPCTRIGHPLILRLLTEAFVRSTVVQSNAA
jgi:hypothetical protein